MMYTPYREQGGASQFTVFVRTAADPLAFTPVLRQKAADVDRRAIVHDVATSVICCMA